MLFLAGDVGKPRRIQGVYMSEKEIRNVVKFLKKEAGEIEYEEIPEPKEQGSFEGGTLSLDDPLLEEAKQLVIQTGKASASYLQRRFRIGYARAASLLDMLEQEGIIGPSDGAKPRQILTKREGEEVEDLGELDETVKENLEDEEDEEGKNLDEIPIPSKKEEDEEETEKPKDEEESEDEEDEF